MLISEAIAILEEIRAAQGDGRLLAFRVVDGRLLEVSRISYIPGCNAHGGLESAAVFDV